jgi:hypothetical protein
MDFLKNAFVECLERLCSEFFGTGKILWLLKNFEVSIGSAVSMCNDLMILSCTYMRDYVKAEAL